MLNLLKPKNAAFKTMCAIHGKEINPHIDEWDGGGYP